MMIRLFILIFVIVFNSCIGKNIGIVTPPYPDGVEIINEALIDPDNFDDEDGWAQSLVKIGNEHFLWLERLHNRIGTKAYFEVVYELRLPELPEGYHYALGSCGYTELDINRADITAIVTNDGSVGLSDKIIRAWKADTDNQCINEIPVYDLHCDNELW